MTYTKYQLGLIGYPLSHSFSKKYFSKKFSKEKVVDYHYELFPLEKIDDLPALITEYPNLLGLNVTIPYKQQVLKFLDEIDEAASNVGAVNTIKIQNGKLKGYNSDIYGFEVSLLQLLKPYSYPLSELKALVLGTGGAAKAVVYVLTKLGIDYQLVSRRATTKNITYSEVDSNCLAEHLLIINTTPLGMSPNIETAPELPYENLSAQHFLYDLVYNPEVTAFMHKGLKKGASVLNGLEMLYLQAEKSWSFWTEEHPL